MSLLPETLQDPVLIAAVTLAVAAVMHYQAGLTWREYRTIHRTRRRIFVTLDAVNPAGFESFVHEKGMPASDPEYLTTVDASLQAVFKTLTSGQSGGDPHLVSSIKRRSDGSLSDAHVVWTHHDDGTQTEAYLFAHPDGVDVYAHRETEASDVEGHLTDGIEPGDPRGMVSKALATPTTDATVPRGE